MNPPLIMDLEDLYRIDSYREYLLSGDGGGPAASVDLLALEDVDEDAEDADATTLDELMMLTFDGDPIWMEELRRYLQEEEEEKERMQNERAVRLARWREDIAVQPA